MLKELAHLIESGTNLHVDRFGVPVDRDIQTMAAVLMVYVAQADKSMGSDEHNAIMRVLAKHFSLQDEDSFHIIQVANFLCKEQRKVKEFASFLAQVFNRGQRVKLMGLMLKVIKADDVVSPLEVQTLEQILPVLSLEKEDLREAISQFEKITHQ